MGVRFPSFCFFFSYISTSLLSIHHVQSAGSLSHSPQTLALLQMRIDPTVNLISMILCRAFSFTASHSAKQTWLFQTALPYRYGTQKMKHSHSRESCKVKGTDYQERRKDMLKHVLVLYCNQTGHQIGFRFQYNKGRDIKSLWKVCTQDLHSIKQPQIDSILVDSLC